MTVITKFLRNMHLWYRNLLLLLALLGWMWKGLSSPHPSRSLRTNPLKSGPGVRIGGLFPLFKTSEENFAKDTGGSMRMAGFLAAIEEINNDIALLPNTPIKFSIQDSKRDEGRAFFSSLALAEWRSQVVVGPASSGTSMNAQLVLQEYHIPQLSYSATSSELSLTEKYPFFSRTPPSDALQARGQVALVKFYNWTHVATISSTDSYGLGGITSFHKHAATSAISVMSQAHFIKGQKNMTSELQQLRDSGARVFVIFCSSSDAARVLEQAHEMGITGEGYVWIGSDSVSKVSTWEEMSDELSHNQRMDIMRGYLGLLPAPGDTTSPEYQAFLPKLQTQVELSMNGSNSCSEALDDSNQYIWRRSDIDGLRTAGGYDACAGIEFDGSVDSYVPYAYDAVFLVARALHQLIELEGKGNVDATGEIQLDGQDLLEAIRNESFKGASGLVQLDTRGDRVSGIKYRVVNHAGTVQGLRTLGEWTIENGFSLCDLDQDPSCRQVVWSGERKPESGGLSSLLCEPGEGLNLIRMRCEPCDPGSFSSEGGLCIPCMPGTFAPDPGMSECLSCNVRGTQYFQDQAGQQGCELCPERSERRMPSPGTSITECVCKELYFQPEGHPNGHECQVCPNGADCAGFEEVEEQPGGTMTRVNSRPVPWKSHWGDPRHPTQFYECTEGFCQQGYACAEGRHGRMCFATSKGWGNINGFLWKCPNGYRSWRAVVGTAAMSVGVLLLFFLVNGVMCKFESIDVFLKNVRVLAVASLFPLRWHKNLEPVLLFFRFAMFDVDVAQPNCILPWSYYESYFLQLACPVFMALVYLTPVMWRAMLTKHDMISWRYVFLNEKSEVASMLNGAISNIISVSSIFYPTILLLLMAAFKCTRSSDQQSYLDIDPTFLCGSSKHVQLQILSGVLLPFVLFMPLLALIFLLRALSLKALHSPVLLERFGGLYQRYRIDYVWWEPLYMLKVTLLVTLQVFGVIQPLAQAFCALLMNSVALAAHFHANPFVRQRSNQLEASMIFMSSVFIVSGNLFYVESFGDKNQEFLSYMIFVMVVCLMILAVYIAAENVRDDLARAASAKMVTRLAQTMVEDREPGDIEGIMSTRLKAAILATKDHGPLVKSSNSSFTEFLVSPNIELSKVKSKVKRFSRDFFSGQLLANDFQKSEPLTELDAVHEEEEEEEDGEDQHRLEGVNDQNFVRVSSASLFKQTPSEILEDEDDILPRMPSFKSRLKPCLKQTGAPNRIPRTLTEWEANPQITPQITPQISPQNSIELPSSQVSRPNAGGNDLRIEVPVESDGECSVAAVVPDGGVPPLQDGEKKRLWGQVKKELVREAVQPPTSGFLATFQRVVKGFGSPTPSFEASGPLPSGAPPPGNRGGLWSHLKEEVLHEQGKGGGGGGMGRGNILSQLQGVVKGFLATRPVAPQSLPGKDPKELWAILRNDVRHLDADGNKMMGLQDIISSVQNTVTAFKALEVTEAAKTLQGEAFKGWLTLAQNQGELTIEDMDRILVLDEWLTPFVSDEAHTSMYARTQTAYFWRNVEKALPDFMEFLSDARQDQVNHVKYTLDMLCRSGAHSTKENSKKRADYLNLISEEDRSSIMFWLTHTDKEQRAEFFKLLKKIVKTKGIDTNQEGFKGAKTRRSNSIWQHTESKLHRIGTFFKDVSNSSHIFNFFGSNKTHRTTMSSTHRSNTTSSNRSNTLASTRSDSAEDHDDNNVVALTDDAEGSHATKSVDDIDWNEGSFLPIGVVVNE